MSVAGVAKRVLMRHGLEGVKLDDAVQAVSTALEGGSSISAWGKVLEALRVAGLHENVASSAARTLAALLEGEPQPHVILYDETFGGLRVILCACGAEFQMSALASGDVIAEDKGYRASIFGPFEADACHLIFEIFMKQVMSVHVNAQPCAQEPAEKA